MSGGSFQARVEAWLVACFGEGTTATSTTERNFRFLEEALELVQACGMTKGDVLQLVDYTFDRAPGEGRKEVGDSMLTLAALCFTHGFDMEAECEAVLERAWKNIEIIRAKQASKLQGTPLPGAA